MSCCRLLITSVLEHMLNICISYPTTPFSTFLLFISNFHNSTDIYSYTYRHTATQVHITINNVEILHWVLRDICLVLQLQFCHNPDTYAVNSSNSTRCSKLQTTDTNDDKNSSINVTNQWLTGQEDIKIRCRKKGARGLVPNYKLFLKLESK